MTAHLDLSSAVEFAKIFINTLAGLMFLANLIGVAVFTCRSLAAPTDTKADKYLRKAVASLWVAGASLFLFWLTRGWGIQLW